MLLCVGVERGQEKRIRRKREKLKGGTQMRHQPLRESGINRDYFGFVRLPSNCFPQNTCTVILFAFCISLGTRTSYWEYFLDFTSHFFHQPGNQRYKI
jgi:hypothetical protein